MRRYALLLFLLSCTLPLAAAITGFVIDENGKPISGARVRALALESSDAAAARLMSATPEPAPIATVQTGDDGAFRIDTKRQPVVTLVAEAPGYGVAAGDVADGSDAGTFLLAAATAKKGRVTADGKPVANAWVIVNSAVYLKTDERGEYTIPDPAKWNPWSLLVLHPDYAPVSRTRTRDTALPLDVTLERGTTVTGRVVDAAGRAVANAIVSDQRGPVAKSGEDGSFTIAHLASDVKQILAFEGTRVGVAKAPGKATIVLRPGAAITGIVRSSKDDLPVAGARVTLRGEPSIAAVTDAKGNFSLAAIPPGATSIIAVHPLFSGTGEELNLFEGARLDRALVVTPITRVTGVVVDEQKKPVAAARIGLNAQIWPESPVSAPDGSFWLRVPPFERNITVTATKSAYATGSYGPVQIAPGEIKSGVRITLPRGTKFEIRLTDTAGAPVANEPVAVTQRAGNDPRGRRQVLSCGDSRCRSDAEGKITLNLIDGPYDVHAGGETTVGKELRAQTLSAATSPLTIELERGAAVEGRVTWSDGSALTVQAMVYAPNSSFQEGVPVREGAFAMRNLPAGKRQLAVRVLPPNGTETEPIDVTAPSTNVVLKVPRPGRIEGRVVERESNRAVRQFTAGTESRGGRRFGAGAAKPFTDDDGRFVLEDVPPGSYDVVITAPGYVRASTTAVEVTEGKAASVEVTLDRGGTVAGRVTSAGRPLAGATINIDDGTRRMVSGKQSDANGDFTLDGVMPGPHEVRVRKDGYVEKSVSIDATAGKEVRADVELARGRDLHGHVTDSSGRPIAGANVIQRLLREGNRPAGPFSWSPITTDAEGSFRLDGVGDEAILVTATKDGYAPGSQEVTAGTSSVNITLTRGGSISGRVLGLSAAELPLVEIWAMGRNMASMGMPNRTSVDATGAFTLTGIPDGDVTVSAQLQQTRRNVSSGLITVTGGTGPFVELDFNAGFVVRGRVTRGGQPVRGMINFSNADPRDRSRANAGGQIVAGAYEVRVPSEGEYRVHVTTDDRSGTIDTPNVLVRGDTTHDVDLRGAALQGRVVDAATGAPMPNVRVILISPGRGADRTTDSAGRFVFEFVPEGKHTLHTTKEGYTAAFQEVVMQGSAPADVELSIGHGEMVELRVVDAANGLDVPRAFFFIEGVPGVEPARTSGGLYRVWLPPGTYSLRVSANQYAAVKVPLVIPAQGPVIVQLKHE